MRRETFRGPKILIPPSPSHPLSGFALLNSFGDKRRGLRIRLNSYQIDREHCHTEAHEMAMRIRKSREHCFARQIHGVFRPNFLSKFIPGADGNYPAAPDSKRFCDRLGCVHRVNAAIDINNISLFRNSSKE